MRAADLQLEQLLDIDSATGTVRLAGQRAVIFDAVALGLLRQELIDTLGATAARGILTRFGYAHGWRTAENLKEAFPWDSPREWRVAGGRLHTLQGLVTVEVPSREAPEPFAHAVWRESYEAEQHLLLLGLSESPVCWSLIGFASGYMSYCNGREILCVEHRCRGRGDAVCEMEGRPVEEWDQETAAQLSFYRDKCLEHSLAEVARALKDTEGRLRRRRRELAREDASEDAPGIIARSEGMRRVIDLARRSARVDATVLITGESGVGKERVARLVHDESSRAAGPFVAVNCAAIAENLLESELFGHARGSFTGATQDRIGLFEAASGGTLFLDEIGELPPGMQVKLLRALQERTVRRVGENRDRPFDARLVAATNRDLDQEVAGGRFRRDLYYRLKVVEIRIPALRERPEDVLPLARAFLAESSRRLARPVCSLAPEAARLLSRHPWPGNVRELENAVERAIVLAAGNRVEAEDLPDEVRGLAGPTGEPPSTGALRPLDEVEREHILRVLKACDGNQTRAAGVLGIGTATLYRRLRRYRLPETQSA